MECNKEWNHRGKGAGEGGERGRRGLTHWARAAATRTRGRRKGIIKISFLQNDFWRRGAAGMGLPNFKTQVQAGMRGELLTEVAWIAQRWKPHSLSSVATPCPMVERGCRNQFLMYLTKMGRRDGIWRCHFGSAQSKTPFGSFKLYFWRTLKWKLGRKKLAAFGG